MNRAELKEIKRLFNLKECCVHKLYGCYVDSEKSIRSTWEQNFLNLSEAEIIHYLNLLRKPLSAGLGKNLVNVELNNMTGEAPWSLERTGQVEYYEEIIDELDYLGHYVILMACGTYDIPGQAADGAEIEDAADVYTFTLTCICPVDLQKPGLVYDTEAGHFTDLVTSRMLQDPQIAILYPAFNDRSMDEGACLCYSKAMDETERGFLERQTGSRLPMPAADERKAYKNILEGVLGTRGTLNEVRKVEEELQLLKQRSEMDQDQNVLSEYVFYNMLCEAGIDAYRMSNLHKLYAAEIGSGNRLNLDNLGDLRAFTIETEYGRLSLNTSSSHRVAIRQIDGKPMLTLELEGEAYVTVNGIKVKIQKE